MLARRAAKAAPRSRHEADENQPGQTRAARSSAERTLPRGRDLAVELARRLGDYASVRYFMKVAAQIESGRLWPELDRPVAVRVVLDKARELGLLRKPDGPINRPAAVFVAWVRKASAGIRGGGRQGYSSPPVGQGRAAKLG